MKRHKWLYIALGVLIGSSAVAVLSDRNSATDSVAEVPCVYYFDSCVSPETLAKTFSSQWFR